MNTAQLIQKAVSSNGAGDDQLISLWTEYARDRNTIKEAIEALSPERRSLFKALTRRTGPLPFDLNKLDQWHHIDLPVSYIRALLPQLLKTGLVAALRKTWGERIYFIPSDIYEVMIELQLTEALDTSTIQHNFVEMPAVQPLSDTDAIEAGEGAAGAVFRLAVRAAEEGLPLTAKGLLHKKTIQRLESELNLQDETLSVLHIQYPFSDTLSIAATLALDVSLRLGLLLKEPGGYRLHRATLKEWLQRPLETWRQALFHIAAEHYVPNQVEYKHIVYALACSSAGIGEEAGGSRTYHWQCAERVMAVLLEQGWLHVPADQQSSAHVAGTVREWLSAAHELGLCDLGTDDAGQWWYRWLAPLYEDASNCAESEQLESMLDGIFVQPDFEVIVPPDSSFLLRWELEMMAERAASEPMITYRLTREACHRAIELRRSLEWQLAFLEQHAMSGVPDNVRDALERWASQYGRVHFAEVVLLRAADQPTGERIAQEIAQNRLAGVVPIGPQDYIVERSQIESLRKQLDQLGLTPLKRWESENGSNPDEKSDVLFWLPNSNNSQDSRGNAEHNGQSLEAAGKGMVYSQSALQYYEMDTSIPEDDVLAQFRQLPAMWTTAVRSYHSSTLRELVDTAVRLRIPLYIEDDQVGSMKVLPIRTDDAAAPAGWSVTVKRDSDGDAESVVLSSSSWKGVRIMLPGWLER
ncbi:helicase-associated domain-containing protein [Paenibacillus marinisediminis]